MCPLARPSSNPSENVIPGGRDILFLLLAGQIGRSTRGRYERYLFLADFIRSELAINRIFLRASIDLNERKYGD
jgi:hypothetical protein